MVFDWEAQLGEKAAPDVRDPLAVFESLDRKATHTILRPIQREALEALRDRGGERHQHAQRRHTGEHEQLHELARGTEPPWRRCFASSCRLTSTSTMPPSSA